MITNKYNNSTHTKLIKSLFTILSVFVCSSVRSEVKRITVNNNPYYNVIFEQKACKTRAECDLSKLVFNFIKKDLESTEMIGVFDNETEHSTQNEILTQEIKDISANEKNLIQSKATNLINIIGQANKPKNTNQSNVYKNNYYTKYIVRESTLDENYIIDIVMYEDIAMKNVFFYKKYYIEKKSYIEITNAIHGISHDLVKKITGTKINFNAKIMFVEKDSESKQSIVSVKTIDNLFYKQLLKENIEIYNPVFSEKFRGIIFIAGSMGHYRLKIYRPDIDKKSIFFGQLFNSKNEIFLKKNILSFGLSPREDQIAISVNEGIHTNIYKIDTNNGKAKKITHKGINVSPSFDAKGSNIFYQSDSTGIQKIHREQALFKKVYDQSTSMLYAIPTVSPDGETIAFVNIKNKKFHLLTMNINTLEYKVIYSANYIDNIKWSKFGNILYFSSKIKNKSEEKIYSININSSAIQEVHDKPSQYPSEIN